MSAAFSTSIALVDMPGAEAVWEASFSTGGKPSVERYRTRAEAAAWLERQTRAFLSARVVMDAPDGDGVVVAPHHEERVVFTAPAVAVRVREASPMFSRPQEAAQVAERIYYAQRLLDEAAAILTEKDFAGDFAPMVWAAKGRVVTLAEHSACEVLEQYPVRNVGDADHHERHLSVVRGGGAA